MPKIPVNGVNLYYEEAGAGTPLLFLHEFGGDYRAWEPQMRYFSRRYRCITYSVRGYPPSDVPERKEDYSQDIAVGDALGLLDALDIRRAHLCGLSMGGYATLNIGVKHPLRALSLTIAGVGYGSGQHRADFQKGIQEKMDILLNEGMEAYAAIYTVRPERVQQLNKDPRGWQEFRDRFASHSPLGSAYTLHGIQGQRPSVQDFAEGMRAMTLPTLVLYGDEDYTCWEASGLMKRLIPSAGLEVIPKSGHAVNIEEPERFNRALLDFLTAVDQGRWHPRDPRSLQGEH